MELCGYKSRSLLEMHKNLEQYYIEASFFPLLGFLELFFAVVGKQRQGNDLGSLSILAFLLSLLAQKGHKY